MPSAIPQLPRPRAHQGRSPSDILLAGFIAGGVSRTCTAPFDRLRSLMAAGSTTTLGANGSTSIVNGIRAMYKTGGLRCMWQGNAANILQVGPESAILFFANDVLTKTMKGQQSCHSNDPPTLNLAQKFLCGASAGIISMSMVYPMYVVQNRMMVADQGMYKSIYDCVWKTYMREGSRAFLQGYLPSLIRIIPYKGIDLTGYTLLKETFVAPGESPTTAQSLAFGATASCVSQTVTHPLLLARTKLQCQGDAMGRPIKYHSMGDALSKTFNRGFSDVGTFGAWTKASLHHSRLRNSSSLFMREYSSSVFSGARMLWAGWGPSMAKNVPAIAIQFAIYDKSLQSIDQAKGD